jgi:hypothetical protein
MAIDEGQIESQASGGASWTLSVWTAGPVRDPNYENVTACLRQDYDFPKLPGLLSSSLIIR